MNINKRESNSLVEIVDLIDEAVSNAVARRKQALDFEELPDEQMETVSGGSSKPSDILNLKELLDPTIGIWQPPIETNNIFTV